MDPAEPDCVERVDVGINAVDPACDGGVVVVVGPAVAEFDPAEAEAVVSTFVVGPVPPESVVSGLLSAGAVRSRPGVADCPVKAEPVPADDGSGVAGSPVVGVGSEGWAGVASLVAPAGSVGAVGAVTAVDAAGVLVEPPASVGADGAAPAAGATGASARLGTVVAAPTAVAAVGASAGARTTVVAPAAAPPLLEAVRLPEDDPVVVVEPRPTVAGDAAGAAGCSAGAELVTVTPPVELDDPLGPSSLPLSAPGEVVLDVRFPLATPVTWLVAAGWSSSRTRVGAVLWAVAALAQKPKSDAVVMAIAPRE